MRWLLLLLLATPLEAQRRDLRFVAAGFEVLDVDSSTVTVFWQPVSDRRGEQISFYAVALLNVLDSLVLASDTTSNTQQLFPVCFDLDPVMEPGPADCVDILPADTLRLVARVQAVDIRARSGRPGFSEQLLVPNPDTIGPPPPVIDSLRIWPAVLHLTEPLEGTPLLPSYPAVVDCTQRCDASYERYLRRIGAYPAAVGAPGHCNGTGSRCLYDGPEWAAGHFDLQIIPGPGAPLVAIRRYQLP